MRGWLFFLYPSLSSTLTSLFLFPKDTEQGIYLSASMVLDQLSRSDAFLEVAQFLESQGGDLDTEFAIRSAINLASLEGIEYLDTKYYSLSKYFDQESLGKRVVQLAKACKFFAAELIMTLQPMIIPYLADHIFDHLFLFETRHGIMTTYWVQHFLHRIPALLKFLKVLLQNGVFLPEFWKIFIADNILDLLSKERIWFEAVEFFVSQNVKVFYLSIIKKLVAHYPKVSDLHRLLKILVSNAPVGEAGVKSSALTCLILAAFERIHEIEIKPILEILKPVFTKTHETFVAENFDRLRATKFLSANDLEMVMALVSTSPRDVPLRPNLITGLHF